MRLNPNKEEVMPLLELVTEMSKIDDLIFTQIRPLKRWPKDKNRTWTMYEYHATLDIVYLMMTDLSHSEVYDQFGTPGNMRSGKPVAWYHNDFCLPEEKYPMPPKGLPQHSGSFIPDAIDNTILSPKVSAKQKYKLLTRMFKELIELQKGAADEE